MTAALALPLVERVIDGDTITVQLDLAPVAGQILTDAAEILVSSTDVAEQSVGLWLRQFARETAAATDAAWRILLSIDQARRLAGGLDEYAEEPERCPGGREGTGCDDFVGDGMDYCPGHYEAMHR